MGRGTIRVMIITQKNKTKSDLVPVNVSNDGSNIPDFPAKGIAIGLIFDIRSFDYCI